MSQPIPRNPDSTACPLAAEQLYRRTELSGLKFNTTVDIEPLNGLVGQSRAADAIRFGVHIARRGFNLFVIGPNGGRMQESVKSVLELEAAKKVTPDDWVYVNNFTQADRPVAIPLPAGRARAFHDAMKKLVDDLTTALPAVFQSEDYQTRRGAIDETFHKRQSEAFSELTREAAEKQIAVVRTPFGFAVVPARDGQVIPPEEFNSWPEEKRRRVQGEIATLEKELEHIVRQVPQWERERRDAMRDLNRETAQFAVGQLIEEAKTSFSDLPRIIDHIERVRRDLVENVGIFIVKGDESEGEATDLPPGSPFDRYTVNVFVSQDHDRNGVPVTEELHPTLGNLIGRIEYLPLRGALVTNFQLIKAGALHRANGGYLLLDVRSLLIEPFSWAALKRALRQGEIKIEDVTRFLGLTSTVSLQPDPIPLDVKVVLFGDRMFYFLLAAYDSELIEHFKVLADFEDDFERTPENEVLLARLIASMAHREGLRPFDRDAVSRVLEHAARLANHSGKLSLVVEQFREILLEADFLAGEAAHLTTSRQDVEAALAARVRRASRLRDRSQEAIIEKVALIDTEGSSTGQINGLSVTELGGFTFGRPVRITCQVRPGSGKVVDIEREAKLGGPIHSKGVLILSGFLSGRYALDTPMSLLASLVFEQSYGGVEGDSASSAELYAILSALSGFPLRQDLAVTGSVNQLGQIQAIGGVNEKIEGFFDICNARGLTGTQGVLIPQANVQHLMLRADVVESCSKGHFAVYPVAMIDAGIALLTGRSAGERGGGGQFPEGSVNRAVENRLRTFASIRKSFTTESPGEAQGNIHE